MRIFKGIIVEIERERKKEAQCFLKRSLEKGEKLEI